MNNGIPMQAPQAGTAARSRNLRSGYVALALLLSASGLLPLRAQARPQPESSAGRVPIISGGAGYIYNASAGVPTLEPQINPVLLVPFGPHLLLESRTDFTGFFERRNQTSGPYGGKVFKTVEFAELDWLATSRITVVGGKYLLPFGLYNERLEPIWIRNLQDPPLTATIGTRTSGAGDGLMLRGAAAQTQSASVQYSAYFSARVGTNQLSAARTAGGDVSVFFPASRLEVGTSYQRFLQNRQINSSAVYISWQPPSTSLDLKVEGDSSYNGHGYWAEAAYQLNQGSVPTFLHKLQPVIRMQEVSPAHGGGNGLPRFRTKRFDFGLNYYLRDNLRLLSSYGRSFSTPQNANVWNLGVTWRFTLPLLPGRGM